VRLPSNRRVLFSDTVGFIRDLPAGLLRAFRATLEEVQEARLLLHVSDISNPRHAEQDAEVVKVLTDLGVDTRPRLHVFNKIDRLSTAEASQLAGQNGFNENVFVSALQGTGLEELLERTDQAMPLDPLVRLEFRVPLSDGRTLALVHALGRVLRSEVSDMQMVIEAELPASIARRLKLKSDRAPA
jgi:GTP-binding protein HflX